MGQSRRRIMYWDGKRVKFLLDTSVAKEFSRSRVYVIGGGWMVK
jgi:hypothetical protein